MIISYPKLLMIIGRLFVHNQMSEKIDFQTLSQQLIPWRNYQQQLFQAAAIYLSGRPLCTP